MPRRRGGLFRGAVGRSRTRHQPSDNGIHRNRCSTGAHRTQYPGKMWRIWSGGPLKRSARNPPGGGCRSTLGSGRSQGISSSQGRPTVPQGALAD